MDDRFMVFHPVRHGRSRFLSREYFRFREDGGSRHIFNPSAFALMVVSIGLLVTDSTACTRRGNRRRSG